MNKIFVIDAVNFLFRSYYAIGPMTNQQGQSTGAVYGFIRSVQKLIREFAPSYLVVVFDGPENKKSRQALYADYKSHRKGAPEDLFPQFAWAEKYCALAGIPTITIEGVEADDTMGAIAKWAEKEGFETYLCSSDKDLMQLVNAHTFMLHAHKDNLLIDAVKVKELFGVRPDQMIDYLALVGDASDNIPGLVGFGPKTAASLLEEFETLDELLAHPENVKGKKQEVLQTGKQQALLSRELATIDCQVKIPTNPSFYCIQDPNHAGLIEFFQDMHFNSLIKDLKVHTKAELPSSQTYTLIQEENELRELLLNLHQQKELGIDTETTGLIPMTADLVGMSFSFCAHEAWYVPTNGKIPKQTVENLLRDFFAHFQGGVYGHNIKYDLHILHRKHIIPRTICFDTLVASYVLRSEHKKHNLDELALELFNKVKIPIDSLIGKGKKEISMQDVSLETIKEYACEDIDYTTQLKVLFETQLVERNLKPLFDSIEMPLIPILQKMEEVGIYLDKERLGTLAVSLNSKIEALKSSIFLLAEAEFNLNSPKQLKEILFDKLQISPPGKHKEKTSTAADVLEQLQDAHPIIPLLLQYRGLEKLRSTYVEALPLSIHPETERIHCTFNQSVTATGRLSCQNPNLQNIPVRTEEGLFIRSCFRPKQAGWSFISGDYSQIELRLLAHFSEDPELLKAFCSGEDIHTHTASLIFNLPKDKISSEMRQQAKTVNFGIIYGQGAFGLSQQLGISVAAASLFIKKYFERYSHVLDYLESCKDSVRKTGVAKTLRGRERSIPDISHSQPMIRSAAERLAINTPLQGTAADLIKLAMIEIDRSIAKLGLKGNMILQIHDELIFEVPDTELSIFQKLIKEHMEGVFSLKVPIEVDISIGKNWAEC